MLEGWITWDLFFQVLFLIIAALGTIIGRKYFTALKEVRELIATIQKALEDGKIDDAEKKVITREAVEAAWAILRSLWFIKTPGK